MSLIRINAKDISEAMSKRGMKIPEELIDEHRVLLEESLSEMLELDIDKETDHSKIREIGRKLSLCNDDPESGTIHLMRVVYYAVIGQKGDGRRYSLSSLWDGIGWWRD